jgi:8-oxo-dGTP pyrophosphatase MutT (NUDIX family)
MIDLAHARAALLGHLPADPTEEAHRDVMLRHLQHAAPFARDTWDPGHFTASAFVSSADGARLLLVFHGKLHRWLQPGGHVDPTDPDLLAAARREVQEETGLDDDALEPGGALLDLDVHTIPARRDDPEHLHLDVRFWLRARAGVHAIAGSDARAVRWVTFDEINGPELQTDESVRRAVRTITRRSR